MILFFILWKKIFDEVALHFISDFFARQQAVFYFLWPFWVIWAGVQTYKLVLVRSWFFSSVPVSVLKPRFLRFHGTGSGTSVLIPYSRYQGFGSRFSGVICTCLILVLFCFHFGSISAPNQVEPKALVLEPKLTGTSTAQNFRYQNTEVMVLSVFSVLDQHYYKLTWNGLKT